MGKRIIDRMIGCTTLDIPPSYKNESKMNKISMVRKITKYQATDGTEFATEEEAEAYETICRNPEYKKLAERVNKLEAELIALRIEVGSLQKPTWPTQTPRVMFENQ